MAISDTVPPVSYPRGGKTVFPLNVQQRHVTDPQTGKTRVQYTYDEAEVEGELTKQKVRAAIRAAKSAGVVDDVSKVDADDKAATQAIAASPFADMTFAELDAYIVKNVKDLASATVFMRKLAAVVLALVKAQE